MVCHKISFFKLRKKFVLKRKIIIKAIIQPKTVAHEIFICCIACVQPYFFTHFMVPMLLTIAPTAAPPVILYGAATLVYISSAVVSPVALIVKKSRATSFDIKRTNL